MPTRPGNGKRQSNSGSMYPSRIVGPGSTCAIVVVLCSFLGSLHSSPSTASSTASGGNSGILSALGSASVAVKASNIQGAGRGAFARRAFQAGERLGRYKCTIGLAPDLTDGVDQAYAWNLNRTHNCDGKPHPLSNPMIYVNSVASLETCGKQNVVPKKDATGVVYYASRAIKEGEELLIDFGRDYFKLDKSLPPYECNMLPLNVASTRGDLSAVKSMLEPPAAHSAKHPTTHVDSVSSNPAEDGGWTPLIEAAAAGHVTVVQYLLDKGASVNRAESMDGRTALFIAAFIGRLEVVSVLLAVPKIDVNNAASDGSTALGVACLNNHATIVEKLLGAKNIDANKASSDGISPLMIATMKGHKEVVSALVSARNAKGRPKVDVNKPMHDGTSALFIACQNSDFQIVKILLGARADASRAKLNGATPLLIAAQNGDMEIARLLITAGADVDHATTVGVTPLFMAQAKGKTELAKMLVDAGARKGTGSPPILRRR